MGLRSKGHNQGTDRARLAATIDERRARVASYKVRGFSIRQIAAELAKDGHLNPTTGQPWSSGVVSNDITFLTEHWKAEARRDISEHIARDLERLDEVEREAWAAWRRSIGKKQQTYVERAGKGQKTSVRSEEADGDPRYFSVILECQKRRSQLLGLDAAEKHEHTGKGGTPLQSVIEVRFFDGPKAEN